jgi:alkylation response protein AidB-like acyl-CoA dehydrogenase
MDLAFSAEDERYRSELRAWLAANADHMKLPREPAAAIDSAKAWQRLLYEGGYVGMAWPKDVGGQGATLAQQVIVGQELARYRSPPLINTIGLDILGPTLIVHGTDHQRRRYLPKILTAEEIWCQGFSEPEAGSDLASLRTRAELHGEVFVVNGQKVWTSLGPIADFCFLLARTDPAAPKREGISYLLCDMRTPGLTARPLRNAAGKMHFSELFFDDVEIPAENLVGELHGGWAIARTSLHSERSGLAGVLDLERHLRRLWATASRLRGRDVAARRALAQLWIEAEGVRHLGYRTLTAQMQGREPGPSAAIGKLFSSEMRKRMMRTALDIEGSLAQVMKRSSHSVDEARWQMFYLDSLAYTIGGGTSEVMRNVIAERVLGLPHSVEDG